MRRDGMVLHHRSRCRKGWHVAGHRWTSDGEAMLEGTQCGRLTEVPLLLSLPVTQLTPVHRRGQRTAVNHSREEDASSLSP